MASDPDQFSGDRSSIKPPEEELAAPDLGMARQDPDQWVVVAKNRRVNRDWLELVQRYPDNAKRCYEFLRAHPMQRVRGRVFPLKGKKYQGAWEYLQPSSPPALQPLLEGAIQHWTEGEFS